MAKLLLVDGDIASLGKGQRWLTASGYDVHTATNGANALAIAREHHCEVAIIELRLPGVDGLCLLSLLKEQDPAQEVIIYSDSGTMEDAIAALSEGRAFHFLRKPLPVLQILNLTIEKALLRRHRCSFKTWPPEPLDRQPLSPREASVLSLLVSGLENDEIAQRLSLSPKTVRNLLSKVYSKLGVSNRMQAVIAWQRSERN